MVCARGFNLGVGLSAGFELADDLYISAALQTAAVPGVLVFDEDIVGGLNVMTTLTWGPDKAHLSLGAMVPMVFDADFVEVHPTFIFGALIEFTDWLALITEHWVSPTMLIERSDFGGSVHMGGVRFQFGGFSFDVAAMHILRVLLRSFRCCLGWTSPTIGARSMRCDWATISVPIARVYATCSRARVAPLSADLAGDNSGRWPRSPLPHRSASKPRGRGTPRNARLIPPLNVVATWV